MKFYVFSGKKINEYLNIEEAINCFESIDFNNYNALGISDENGEIDLLCENKEKKWISNDYKYTHFKIEYIVKKLINYI